MQFDKAAIAVRQRNFMDILDLALQVVRAQGWPLLALLAVGAVPMALLNNLLLGQWVGANEIWQDPLLYLLWMTVLIALETPFATAPLTLYLGQTAFDRDVSPRQLVRDFARSLPQLIWFQVLLRALTALLFLIGLVIPYVAWPYLSEVILLERNPLRTSKTRSMTTWRRSRNLHRHSGGDLFARWLGSLGVGAILVAMLVWGCMTTVGHRTGH